MAAVAAEVTELAKLAPVADEAPVAEEATEEEPEHDAAEGSCTWTLQ